MLHWRIIELGGTEDVPDHLLHISNIIFLFPTIKKCLPLNEP